jgi:putative spermidine/putrescine transport system permease protein
MAASGFLLNRVNTAPQVWSRNRVWLLAPLALFLLVFFLVPLAMMLTYSVRDAEVSKALPSLRNSSSNANTQHLALARDAKAAKESGALAEAARRLNLSFDGGRSLLMGLGRAADNAESPLGQALARNDADAARLAMAEINPRWNDSATWNALSAAKGPFTDFYLLASVDRQRDVAGYIVQAPEVQRLYLDVLARTFGIALSVTLLCLALGFPVAYLLCNVSTRVADSLMVLVLLPFWTSLLVRTAAWVVLLQKEGLINSALLKLGVIAAPLELLYNRTGVVIAMTHVLLPFMILPLYSVMKGIPAQYMRAAMSLGATPVRAFVRVYVPQALPGIAAGCLLVFILALGYYITPALVGGGGDQMLAAFIAQYTTETANWGLASALGVLLLAATLVLFALYLKVTDGKLAV